MSFKIGVKCYGGIAEFRQFKSWGYDCIDFALNDTNSRWYTLSKEEVEPLLIAEKKNAEVAGVVLHQCHGPWMGTDFYKTPEERAIRMEENRRSLWCASILGIKNWVTHPVMPFGISDNGREDETYKINYEFFCELLGEAKKYDITICLENLPFTTFSLSEIDKIKGMVDKIGDENFKICLDTGHVNCFRTRNLGDAIRICGDDLRVLHVHDNWGEDRHMIPYFGSANWESFYSGLCDIGFDGVISLETAPPHKMGGELFAEMQPLVVKIIKRIVHDDVDIH